MQILYSLMLVPSSFMLYVATCIVIYHFYNRDAALRVLCIIFLSMAFNAYLKSIFQVPLLPHLDEGWALPSGHTQAGVVFFGWFAFEMRHKVNPLWCIIPIIVLSSGIYLNHFHEVIDILAAYVSAGFVILCFYYITFLVKKNTTYLGLICLLISSAFLLLYPKPLRHFAVIIAGLTVCALSSILIKSSHPFHELKMLRLAIITLLIFTFLGGFYFFLTQPISFDGYFIITFITGTVFFIFLPSVFDSKIFSRRSRFLN